MTGIVYPNQSSRCLVKVGLFENRPHLDVAGPGEPFDRGRDLPGADEHEQQILWDVEK